MQERSEAGLEALKKKKKKSQREPDMLTNACDPGTFKVCGLVPSKYHRKKSTQQEGRGTL